MLHNWWVSHRVGPIPLSWLSTNGFIASEKGIDLACGFIYTTDSDVVWMDNLIANPKSPKELRSEAIDAVLKEMIEWVPKVGGKVYATTSKFDSIKQRLTKLGARCNKDKFFLFNGRVE